MNTGIWIHTHLIVKSETTTRLIEQQLTTWLHQNVGRHSENVEVCEG
jgi:hypothetical protein